MTISRRALLSASAGLAAAVIARPAAALPREADVAVIGAGAAGIAAARRIMAAGRSVVVLEATDRIGGRCQTQTSGFSAPFDRGARWLHNPESNAVARLARTAGLDVSTASAGQKVRIGRRNARTGETEDLLAALVRANRAIDDAARNRLDASCATVLPKDLGDWTQTIAFLLGPVTTGKDLAEVSIHDHARAQDRVGFATCRQGVGALIEALGRNAPVALKTPATRIAWSNREVVIETPAGRVQARAAIVTASTAVLASGVIKFVPDIPKRQIEAASRLTLGSIERIALELPGNPLGLARDEAMIEQARDARTAVLAAHPGGATLCAVDVMGSFGRDLAAQGETAMIAFAKEWIAGLFGSDAIAKLGATAATRWGAQPFVLGAVSAAPPGAQPMRRQLAEPAGALLFAGEATHEQLYGTVDGAWESGERAAEAALRKIGALKDAAPPPAAPKAKRRTPAAEAKPF